MVYTDSSFTLFPRTGYILSQHNTDYSVKKLNSVVEGCFSVSLMSSSDIPFTSEGRTPGHIKCIGCNLIPLSILFDTGGDTLPSCAMDKIHGAFLLWRLYSLPCLVLFN